MVSTVTTVVTISRLVALVLAFGLLGVSAPGWAQAPLTIAAASDLQGVLPRIAAAFEAHTSQPTRLVFGSSGTLYAQIQQGAPFDVFLSADDEYVRQLEAARLALADSTVQYATGVLVLYVRHGVDGRAGLQLVTMPHIRRVAIANPQHAPYGRAAVSALQAAGVYDAVRPKLVYGESVSQAAQFVQSGNADAGLIARALALLPALAGAGTATALPDDAYPPIRQAGTVLSRTPHVDTARRFLEFLVAQDAQTLLLGSGFRSPTPR